VHHDKQLFTGIVEFYDLEKLVIDLSYNQGKTFREVQKIVRKSPRDIKTILDKYKNPNSVTTSSSKSSQAYRMFELLFLFTNNNDLSNPPDKPGLLIIIS
jgi:hypothetical protein